MKDFLSDDLIDFEPIAHSYTNRRTNQRYLGVTTFIGRFEPEYDLEYWSAREAVKRFLGERSAKYAMFKMAISTPIKNEFGQIDLVDKEKVTKYINKNPINRLILLKIQDEVKRDWKENNINALNKGSAFHNHQEDKANFNKFRILENGRIREMADFNYIPQDIISNDNKINLSHRLPDGAYTELLVKNHKYKMSGQMDFAYIETIDGIRYMDIDDYKTNDKLTFSNVYDTFLPPLNFLQHHKVNIYSIQLLLYGWMAEQYGFVIRNVRIIHQPNELAVPKIIPIHKFPKENDPIKIMLNIRKKEIQNLY